MKIQATGKLLLDMEQNTKQNFRAIFLLQNLYNLINIPTAVDT